MRSNNELLPIVVVQVPCEPSVSRFYAMVLTSIGAPIRPHARVVEFEQVALKLLRQVKTKILIIDELHNMFDKSCSLLIATAIDLMEKGELTPTGKEGKLFSGHERAGEKAGLVQSTSENGIDVTAFFNAGNVQSAVVPSKVCAGL